MQGTVHSLDFRSKDEEIEVTTSQRLGLTNINMAVASGPARDLTIAV